MLLADQAAIQQAVCAGVGDIAAHGAADDGGDGGEVDRVRPHGLAQRFAQWWIGGDGDEQGEQDHQQAQHHDQTINSDACALGQEDTDGDERTEAAAPFRIQPHQRIQAQAGTSDVADVEHQPAEDHQHRQQIAATGNCRVGQVRGAHTGQGDDTPDVQLDHEVDEDRSKDAEGKGGAHGCCEGGGLGDEAGANGRSGHQENGRDQ